MTFAKDTIKLGTARRIFRGSDIASPKGGINEAHRYWTDGLVPAAMEWGYR